MTVKTHRVSVASFHMYTFNLLKFLTALLMASCPGSPAVPAWV